MPENREIERRWMVSGWPEGLALEKEEAMRQGYVTVIPAVRIREETKSDTGDTRYMLCFKSGDGLERKEIEFPVEKERFSALEDFIGLPLIQKVRRTYRLPDGSDLEVNHVDEGLPTEFWYAEVEFPDTEAARNWNEADVRLAEYLADDITDEPGQSMAAYWAETRLKE